MLNQVGNQPLRMLDNFQMGPNLVRGFAPNGIGPRDLTFFPYTQTGDALGGTKYWGASLEFQMPFWFLPKEVGLKGAVYADAGSLWDYQGPTSWAATGRSQWSGKWPNLVSAPWTFDDENVIRTSVGCRLDLGVAVRSAAVRLRNPDYEGQVRRGPGIQVRRRHFVLRSEPEAGSAAWRRPDILFRRCRPEGCNTPAADIVVNPRLGYRCWCHRLGHQLEIGHNAMISGRCLLGPDREVRSTFIGALLGAGPYAGLRAEAHSEPDVFGDVALLGRNQSVSAAERPIGRIRNEAMEEAPILFEDVDINTILNTLPHRYPDVADRSGYQYPERFQRHRRQERHVQ